MYAQKWVKNTYVLREHKSQKGFDLLHVLLLRTIVSVMPDLLTSADSPIILEMTKLAKECHEEDQQCTAAEVIAGIVRGIKHWDFDDYTAVKNRIMPILSEALTAAQTDCIPHWFESIQVMS